MKPPTATLWNTADRVMVKEIKIWMKERKPKIIIEDIASAINCSYSRVQNVLNERNYPFTLSQFVTIAELCGKDPALELYLIVRRSQNEKTNDLPMTNATLDNINQLLNSVTSAAETFVEHQQQEPVIYSKKRELSKE